MQQPTETQLAPFADIIETYSLRRMVEINRKFDQLAVFGTLWRDGETIVMRYSEEGPEFRFVLKPVLRAEVSQESTSNHQDGDCAAPQLPLVLPRDIEADLRSNKDAERTDSGDKASPDNGDRSPKPGIDRRRANNKALLRELALATHGPIRDFIEAWSFPGDGWNLHQACRFSERFRAWAIHHPQLAYLVASNMPLGAFDGPDNSSLLTWITGGSFPRMLKCAGLPPIRAVATVLRRLPPPLLGGDNLRRTLHSISRDTRRLDIACNLPAPLHPEILELLASDQLPFSRPLIQTALKALNQPDRGRPEQFPPPPEPGRSRRHWTATLAPMRIALWYRDTLEATEGRRFEEQIPHFQSPRSLLDLLLNEDRGTLFGRVSFFPATSTVRPLTTLRDLVQVADDFDNCLRSRLADYVLWILSRGCHLYLCKTRREAALLQIVRSAREKWNVEQFLGPKNRRPSGHHHKLALRWTQTHGIDWPPNRDPIQP